MKKYYHGIFLLLGFIFYTIPLFATPPQAPLSQLDSIVGSLIAEYKLTQNVPGIAVVLYDKGSLYFYNSGVMNVNTRQPVTQQTIFELGSITKVFTATLLAEQIQNGSMSLSDPVTKYLKVGGSMNQVTLRELATHTSGLPSIPPHLSLAQRAGYTKTNLMNFISLWRPKQPIGSHYLYSNIGFGLLGYILESATGKKYDDLLQQHLFAPLGMNNTTLNTAANTTYYAQGYNLFGKPVPHWPVNAWPAGGALRSTTQDMGKFLEAYLGDPQSGASQRLMNAMQLATQKYFQTQSAMGQGLAWQIFPNGIINKFGGTNGFNTYIALYPSKKLGIVVLTNRQKSHPNWLGNRILFQVAKINSKN